MQKTNSFEQLAIAKQIIRWSMLVMPVAIVTGSLVALFLWLLDEATHLRHANNWLLFLLPFAGIGIYFLYQYAGKKTEAGNNLILEAINEPSEKVPLRMTPLVLFTTIITHLFGGSAGREGTAVQIGGSIASFLSKWIKLSKDDTKLILLAGIAAGFGAVFGTPITGAIFALEVIAVGKINYKALLPCLIASMIADITCTAYGIEHTKYTINFQDVMNGFSLTHFNFLLIGKVIIAGISFGFTGYVFSELLHTIKNFSNKLIKEKWHIPFIGGTIIILLAYLLGTTDYLGLGVISENDNSVTIASSFNNGGANYFTWFWKIIFTTITIGMGFKGGEVTPLFFIGATLGNTIAVLLGAPVDLMAGLGFIAVFAAATNTPIACTIMGVELFGGNNIMYYAIACFFAYYFSGHTGIYSAQRIGVAKNSQQQLNELETIQQIRNKRIKK